MSRYIEKEKVYTAIDIVRNYCIDNGMHFETTLLEMAMNEVGHIPTADVQEVRHGEWVVDAYKGDEIVRIPYVIHQHDEPYCSLCGTYALLDGKEDYVSSNFCPRCGAKMDGEKE